MNSLHTNSTKQSFNSFIYLDKLNCKISLPNNENLDHKELLEFIKLKIIIIEHIQREYEVAYNYYLKEINEDHNLKGSRKLDKKTLETYKNMGKLLRQISIICNEICTCKQCNEVVNSIAKYYQNDANCFFKSILKESYLIDIKNRLPQDTWENSIMRKPKSNTFTEYNTLLTKEHERLIQPLQSIENPFNQEEEPNFFRFVEAAINLAKSNREWDNKFYRPFIKHYRQHLRDVHRSSCYGNTQSDGKTIYMNSQGGGRGKHKITPKTYTDREIEDLFRKTDNTSQGWLR